MFGNQKAAEEFIGSAKTNQKARLIVHQCARMLYLADKVYQKGRPALDVLFFIIIAEAVAKIFFDFQKEGESKRHVQKFFEEICTDSDKKVLNKLFKKQFREEDSITDNYLTL